MPNCSCMQKCMDVFYNDVLHVYAKCVCVGGPILSNQGSTYELLYVHDIFPLREVPILKRDAIEENHCLIQ